jgi:hypothetical protein
MNIEKRYIFIIMSRAIASARQRRAGISSPEPPPLPIPKQDQSQGQSQGGLTLPQVISLVDTRLTKLEKFMKDTQEKGFQPSERNVQFTQVSPDIEQEDTMNLTQILEEYNNRFLILAEEMGELKDTLMKLQTYTMDVNKMLLEERVNVLSDLGEDKGVFMMGDDTTLIVNEIEGV